MDAELLRQATRGRGLFAGDVYDVLGESRTLAIDVLDRWGGTFELSVGRRGVASTTGLLWTRDAGAWSDSVSGGGTYGGFELPWRPAAEWWATSPVARLSSCGQDVEVGDDEWEPLRVHVGFVAPGVTAIDVADAHGRRTVEVPSPIGAFAALAFGEDVTISPA